MPAGTRLYYNNAGQGLSGNERQVPLPLRSKSGEPAYGILRGVLQRPMKNKPAGKNAVSLPDNEKGVFMENHINGTTLIGEIVEKYPEAVGVLFACGMHCIGCPASREESLEEACMVHGLDADLVINAVNEKIASSEKKTE